MKKLAAVVLMAGVAWLSTKMMFYNSAVVREFVSSIDGTIKACMSSVANRSDFLICRISEYPEYMEVMIHSDGAPSSFIKSVRESEYNGPFKGTLSALSQCSFSERKIVDGVWIVNWPFNSC